MSLATYQKKRNFKKTTEPASGRGAARKGKLLYVIQKHAASHLHYDFRLELDGVLKSWAVPKGPSLDPQQKQLAVHVEDHPIAYGDFEGTIPKGEYGGGTVMVWDQGTWEPHGNARRDYKSGKLTFTLHGKKLRGDWTLVEMHGKAGQDGKNWLLIKKDDNEARSRTEFNILEERSESVLSDRSLDEIAGADGPTWKSNRSKQTEKAIASKENHRNPAGEKAMSQKSAARRKTGQFDAGSLSESRAAPMPKELKPQLATLVAATPDGEGWVHEMKFDGYRLLAFCKKGSIQLITRNGNDWTAKFPTVVESIAALGLKDAILDGEVVLLTEKGIPDFQRLQNSIKSPGSEDFTYYVFDLPYWDGYDLRASPLIDRKNLLQLILQQVSPQNDGPVRYSEHIQGQGEEVSDQSCLHGMEGVVSKRVDSLYESGRSDSWVKSKCHRRQEFVIGGYTKPSGSRTGFGSLLLGYYEGGELRYCGRVGTGFTETSLKDLSRELRSVRTETRPFSSKPPGTRDLASWVKPVLVAEVEFTEWTDEFLLRHPSFKGLRQDKPATAIIKEEERNGTPKAKKTRSSSSSNVTEKNSSYRSGKLELAGVTITHPERIVYPSIDFSKGDLAKFIFEIADWMLSHVADRPLTLVRCPSGQKGECFYQKHLGSAVPEGVTTIPIKEKSKTGQYVVVHDVTGLMSLIQYGVMEIHTWGSRADKVEKPDRIVFDLDPGEGTNWQAIIKGAQEIRTRLSDLGLQSFPRTSGGKGLHVVVPLVRRTNWEDVKEFAHRIAIDMAHDAPDRYLSEMSKSQRAGKIFVDYLRNGRGATAIASFSTRAREGAPVATPFAWDELSGSIRPDSFTVLNLQKRLQSLKSDPWEGFFEVQQTLTKKMQKAVR